MLAYAGGLGWAIQTGRLPFETTLVVAGLSAATFTAYALDKHAARTGCWRFKESTLHVLELAGGWPGAWLGQRWLRHKSRKPGYQAVFWCLVLLHLAVLAAWVLEHA